MKKKLLACLFTVVCFAPTLLTGALWTTSAGISCFSPKSSHICKIYGDHLTNYELAVSRSVFCNWEIWSALNYYTASGHLPHVHRSSRIKVLPLSLGLSYNWKICKQLYWNIGAGGAYTYAHFNHYDAHKKSLTKWGGGAVFKTSLKYYCFTGIVFDIFITYFYQHFNHHRYKDSSNHFSNYSLNNNNNNNNNCFIDSLPIHHKRKPALNVGGTSIGLSVGYVF